MAEYDSRTGSASDAALAPVVNKYEKPMFRKPEFWRIGADEAETGINNGPEILILLS